MIEYTDLEESIAICKSLIKGNEKLLNDPDYQDYWPYIVKALNQNHEQLKAFEARVGKVTLENGYPKNGVDADNIQRQQRVTDRQASPL